MQYFYMIRMCRRSAGTVPWLPYAEDGTLSSYYTSGMSCLVLNTENGDWSYYNPSTGLRLLQETATIIWVQGLNRSIGIIKETMCAS